MFDKAKRKSILSTCRTEEVSAENNISENNLKKVVDTDQARWYIIKARSERAARQIFENWTGKETHYKRQVYLCKKVNRKRFTKNNEQSNKWRVWSWLRINAGGVPNTCKSIAGIQACLNEGEANGWVIHKQPAHEDWDNSWKRGLIPDRQ